MLPANAIIVAMLALLLLMSEVDQRHFLLAYSPLLQCRRHLIMQLRQGKHIRHCMTTSGQDKSKDCLLCRLNQEILVPLLAALLTIKRPMSMSIGSIFLVQEMQLSIQCTRQCGSRRKMSRPMPSCHRPEASTTITPRMNSFSIDTLRPTGTMQIIRIKTMMKAEALEPVDRGGTVPVSDQCNTNGQAIASATISHSRRWTCLSAPECEIM